MSRIMLLSLHNPQPENPRVLPLPQAICDLIAEHEPGYTRFYSDFDCAYMYPTRRAPEGKGRKASDLDAFANAMTIADALGIEEVILLGQRVMNTFNAAYDDNIQWLESRVIQSPNLRRFWSMPHPSGLNYWYTIEENRKAAGKLLNTLRTKEVRCAS